MGDNIHHHLLYDLHLKLDELYLPYKIDLSVYAKIENPDLVKHIDSIGKVFYIKETKDS